MAPVSLFDPEPARTQGGSTRPRIYRHLDRLDELDAVPQPAQEPDTGV